MKLDDAIKVALKYEKGVEQVYRDAMNKTSDVSAKRIFEVLCKEEADHVAYLQSRLKEWEQAGKIEIKSLGTLIPGRESIKKSLEDLAKTVKPKPTKLVLEIELLKKALESEIKTSNFYKEMVQKLDGDGQKLFERFVEIEEGHEAIVQAQIDAAANWGFWFDTPEFRLESE